MTTLTKVKVKKVKISFYVNVDIDAYIDDYGLDSEKEAVACIRNDAENAARAQLELVGHLINMGAEG